MKDLLFGLVTFLTIFIVGFFLYWAYDILNKRYFSEWYREVGWFRESCDFIGEFLANILGAAIGLGLIGLFLLALLGYEPQM